MCLESDGGKHARACSHKLGARTNYDEKNGWERVCLVILRTLLLSQEPGGFFLCLFPPPHHGPLSDMLG